MPERKKTDKWIPWSFVVFFLCLAVVDGVFVTIALSTHRGVVTEHAYEKGLNYNTTIRAAKHQTALAWQGNIGFHDPELLFTLKDRSGNALQGAKVVAYFTRPTQEGYDFSTVLDEDQPGTYRKAIQFSLNGLWDVKIAVLWNSQHYQQHKRIVVK